MKRDVRTLIWLYERVQSLYPRTYREEYSQEMSSVFGLTANAAAQHSLVSLLKLGLRELYDLPRAAIREHVRAAREQRSTMDERIAISRRLNRGFGVWAVWVLAHAVVSTLTIMAAVLLGPPLDNLSGTLSFAVPVFSVLVTIAQWLVLVYHLPIGWGWLAASLVGWAAGSLMAYACNRALSLGWYSLNAPLSALLVVGFVVGAAQWVVLRRHSRRAIFWIPASAAGWALLGFTFQAGGTTLGATVLIGAIPAAMTGVVLAAMADPERVGY